MALAKKSKRGFNLIEAAIVLGVVGLVIGGIWVAAAKVSYDNKWRQTEAGWIYYVDFISKNFTRAQAATLSGNQDIETTLMAMAGLPGGWGCCGDFGKPLDPFGNTFYAQMQGNTFFVGYANQTPPKDFCVRWMLMAFNRILGPGKMLDAHFYNFTGAPGSCDPDGPGGAYNDITGISADTVVNNCCPNGGLSFVARYPN